jgi:hypothetical protein
MGGDMPTQALSTYTVLAEQLIIPLVTVAVTDILDQTSSPRSHGSDNTATTFRAQSGLKLRLDIPETNSSNFSSEFQRNKQIK